MLTSDIDRYLALRRAAGFKLLDAERLLRSYARFASKRREQHVRIDTALEWSLPSVPDQRRRRLEHLSIFARYARVEDPRHEVPDPAFYAGPRSTVGFRSSSTVGRSGPSSALPANSVPPRACARTLSPPCSGCSRRPGCASARRSVCGSPTTRTVALRFATRSSSRAAGSRCTPRRVQLSTRTSRVVRAPRRRPITSSSASGESPTAIAARGMCATICRGLGIVRSDGPAHLHDLRHSFAVRALERCRGDRFAIREHMIALMTYLGHACVVSTYWYLHTTPSLMSAIATTTERHFRGGLS